MPVNHDLIGLANESFDARALVSRIGFLPDQVSLQDDVLKCHCPVHKGREFKTLQVYLKSNTCECTFADCPASERRTIVALYALVKETGEYEAATELIRDGGCFRKGDARGRLADFLAARAVRMLAEGDAEQALDAAEMGLCARPKDPCLLISKGRALERADRMDEALEAYEQAAAVYAGHGEQARAAETVEREVLRLAPGREAALRYLAQLQKEIDPRADDWARTCIRIADLLLADGSYVDAQMVLGEVLEAFEKNADAHRRLAESYFALEMEEDGRQELDTAAELLEAEGRDGEALEVLQQLMLEVPRESVYRERCAGIRERLKDRDGAARDLELLAREALDEGDGKKARGYCERLAANAPRNIFARERLAEFAGADGRVSAQIEHLFILVDVLREMEIYERAMEVVEEIADLAPKTLEQTRRHAGIWADLGRFDDAADQFLALGETYLATFQKEAALDVYMKVSEVVPLDLARLEKAAAALASAGYMDKSFAILLTHARGLVEVLDFSAALEAVDKLKERFGETEELSDVRLEILFEMADERTLVPAVIDAWKHAEERGRFDEAEEELLRALRLFPRNVELCEELAGYYLDMGRDQDAFPLLLSIADSDSAPLARRKDALEQAQEIVPDHSRALAIKAHLVKESGMPAAAVDLYVKAARRFLEENDFKGCRDAIASGFSAGGEKDRRLYELLGELLLLLDDHKAAYDAFSKCVALYLDSGDPETVIRAVDRIRQRVGLKRGDETSYAVWLEQQGEGERAFEVWLALAHDVAEEGDWEDVLEIIERALVFNGDSFEAHQLRADAELFLGMEEEALETMRVMALLARQQRRLEEAVKTLEGVESLAGLNDEETLTLAELYKDLGESGKQKEVLGRLMERYREADSGDPIPMLKRLADLNPDNAGLLRELADEYEKREERDEALACLERVLALKPDDRLTMGRLADLALALGREEEGIRWLNRLIQVCEAEGGSEERIAALRRLYELDPEKDQGLERLARALGEAGRIDEAAGTWNKLIGQIHERGHVNSAFETARAARKAVPQAIPLRQTVIELAGELSRHQDMAIEVKDFVRYLLEHDEQGEAIAALTRQSEMLVDLKEFSLAGELLREFGEFAKENKELARLEALAHEGLDEIDPAVAAWLRLAEWHGEEKEVAERESALRRAMALKPRDAAPRRALIDTLAGAGDSRKAELALEYLELGRLLEEEGPDEAAGLYRKALEIEEANASARENLAELLERQGKHEEALAEFACLGELCAEFGQFEAAEAAFKRALKKDPDSERALLGLLGVYESTGNREDYARHGPTIARWMAAKGDRARAIDVLNHVIAGNPKDAETRRLQIELMLEEENTEGALVRLRELRDLYGENADPARERDCLVKMAGLDSGNTALLEEIASLHADREEREERATYIQRAADAYTRSGDYENAVRLCNELVELDPFRTDWGEKRAAVLIAAGDKEHAGEELIRLAGVYHLEEDEEKELEAWKRLESLGVEYENTSEAIAKLLHGMGRNDEAAAAWLAISKRREQEGDDEGAFQAAMEADKTCPGNQAVLSRLADIYAIKGEASKGAELCFRMAGLASEAGDFEGAKAQVEWALSLERTLAGLQSAGEIFLQGGEPERAAACFIEAADMASSEKDIEKAGALYRRARELAPADRDVLRRAAQFLAGLGDPSADDLYLQALAFLLSHGEVGESRSLLSEALDCSSEPVKLRRRAAEAYREAGIPELAIREMAVVAAQMVADGQFEDARLLVEEALSLRSNDLGAMELHYEVLSALEEDEMANKVAEKLISIFRARDDKVRAEELFRRAVQRRPSETQPRRHLVQIVEARGDEDALAKELRDLAEIQVERADHVGAADTLKQLLMVYPDDSGARLLYIQSHGEFGPESDLADDYQKLGVAYHRQGKLEDAAKAFEKVLSLAPDSRDALNAYLDLLLDMHEKERASKVGLHLSELYLQAEEPRKAWEISERIRVDAESNPDFHRMVSGIYKKLHSPGMAARELMRARELYREARRAGDEVDASRELIRIDSLNLEYHKDLIQSLIRNGRHQEAVGAMEDLAKTYTERGLYDLAETEYRHILQLEPLRDEAWTALFRVVLEMGEEKDLISDYMDYADTLAAGGRANDALGYYIKVMEMDRRNIRAHRGYITQYPKIGKQSDIIDDMLNFAQMLVESGEVDEAVRYFELVMSIDPGNTVARDMLTATQARGGTDKEDGSAGDGGDIGLADLDLSRTQVRLLEDSGTSASDFLRETLNEMERDENKETLRQIEQNYRDLLAVNPLNASVRIKLANVLEQMGRYPEMLDELKQASETFFNRGELQPCINTCERYLKEQPADKRMRARLNEAILRRDAFEALKSDILFGDSDDLGDG